MIDVLETKPHAVAKWVAGAFYVLAVCVLIITVFAVIQCFQQLAAPMFAPEAFKRMILLDAAILSIGGIALATLFVFLGQVMRYLASAADALSEISKKLPIPTGQAD